MSISIYCEAIRRKTVGSKEEIEVEQQRIISINLSIKIGKNHFKIKKISYCIIKSKDLNFLN